MNAPTEPLSDQVRERAALTSRELRRRRLRRIAIVSALSVGLPTLLATLYFGVLASRQYESEAVVTLTVEPTGTASHKVPPGLDLIRQHMLSRAALDDVDRKHGLVAHYQDADADWWSRLGDGAGSKDVFDYYRGKVRVSHEPDAGAVTVRVRAFSPEKAQEFAGGLIESTRVFLDELSASATRDIMAPADQAVADARTHLTRLRAANPAPAAGSEAEVDQAVAHEQLTAALRGQEEARTEAGRRQRHLAVVAAPSLPDQASEPRPLWSITTVFVTAAALMGVIWLLLAAVREHSRF